MNKTELGSLLAPQAGTALTEGAGLSTSRSLFLDLQWRSRSTEEPHFSLLEPEYLTCWLGLGNERMNKYIEAAVLSLVGN